MGNQYRYLLDYKEEHSPLLIIIAIHFTKNLTQNYIFPE